MPFHNPLEPFLERQGLVVLDGGLATELEARGVTLDDELWSARVLIDSPDDIRHVHLEYLRAGADCITGASYQASVPGFLRHGIDEESAQSLLKASVGLARDARDEFWRDADNRENRIRPIVAASIGPYGAYLADGSEYTGRYAVDRSDLLEFHGPRWQVLADSGADLFACETIPSRVEASVLLQLLAETPQVPAWLSFSCRDGTHLSDGSPIAEAVLAADGVENLVAVGINCTAPKWIAGLVTEVCRTTEKAVVVYPNSGETYDAESRRWIRGDATLRFDRAAHEWHALGASLIGGCCRTRPADISALRRGLLS
jgi:homocysteine S-methyltransferase